VPPLREDLLLSGIGTSPGIVIGPALLVGRCLASVREIELAPEEVEGELNRFHAALEKSAQQIEELKTQVVELIGEKDAAIFDAHLMLVADKVLIDEVEEQIQTRRRNAEFVFGEVIDGYATALAGVEDAYIRDRLTDIRDVAERVIRNLAGDETVDLRDLSEPCIVVADDLSPSDTAGMDRENVLGFVTSIGSRTSHTAIMARAMGIPAVVGVTGVTEQVVPGDRLIIDGSNGHVMLRPSRNVLRRYRRRLRKQEVWLRNIEAEAELPAETIDGFRVQLAVNIELPTEVAAVKRALGVGIGLFRTEFLFLNATELPDEEQQYRAYRKVTEEIAPQSVIFRTLDIGGDKFLSHLNLPGELNPFLGVRAIRLCLSRPDLFAIQLRAILRASIHGKVRIMFPMISTTEELQQAIHHLNAARRELDRRGQVYHPSIDVGIMIEVPAAAMIADKLAPHIDFFSIGTNDLVQYSLAADRANPEIAYLYQPSHPSIIRMLQRVVEAAYTYGKWVGVCGEMASHPVDAMALIGIGFRDLSVSPPAVGPVKMMIRSLNLAPLREYMDYLHQCGHQGIREKLKAFAKDHGVII